MENQSFSSQSHEDGSITINSGDRLTIENAADFISCISTALAASQHVALEFNLVVDVDITALQILCSACKTATEEGKTFTHLGSLSAPWRQMVISTGAGRHVSCKHNDSNPCNWFGGNA